MAKLTKMGEAWKKWGMNLWTTSRAYKAESKQLQVDLVVANNTVDAKDATIARLQTAVSTQEVAIDDLGGQIEQLEIAAKSKVKSYKPKPAVKSKSSRPARPWLAIEKKYGLKRPNMRELEYKETSPPDMGVVLGTKIANAIAAAAPEVKQYNQKMIKDGVAIRIRSRRYQQLSQELVEKATSWTHWRLAATRAGVAWSRFPISMYVDKPVALYATSTGDYYIPKDCAHELTMRTKFYRIQEAGAKSGRSINWDFLDTFWTDYDEWRAT